LNNFIRGISNQSPIIAELFFQSLIVKSGPVQYCMHPPISVLSPPTRFKLCSLAWKLRLGSVQIITDYVMNTGLHRGSGSKMRFARSVTANVANRYNKFAPLVNHYVAHSTNNGLLRIRYAITTGRKYSPNGGASPLRSYGQLLPPTKWKTVCNLMIVGTYLSDEIFLFIFL